VALAVTSGLSLSAFVALLALRVGVRRSAGGGPAQAG
jgi:hypothetical protein